MGLVNQVVPADQVLVTARELAAGIAGFDPLVDEGREYAERMQKEGVQVEYKNHPDMVHGFITMGRVVDAANTALADCAHALKKAWRI